MKQQAIRQMCYNFFLQLYRIECAGAFFVVRAKKNLQYKVIRWKRRMPKGVLSDSIIELITYKSRNDYPKQLRRVEYYDEVLKKNLPLMARSLTV